LQLLGRYALTLARYDQDYDVRDRARLVASLLTGVMPSILADEEHDREHGGVILRREQVKVVLFEHKAPVKELSALEGAHLLEATPYDTYTDQERMASPWQHQASLLAKPWRYYRIFQNGWNRGRNPP
jgi:hypothetical protein